MQPLNRRDLLKRLAVGGAAAMAAATCRGSERKPNFVFILIDDMGWKDAGCYGSRFYDTPGMDRLASEGMRFTNNYTSAPLCSPTRGSILTGKYPVRLGMTHITQYKPDRKAKWLCPETAKQLALSEVTIAEALKPAGYTSACIGKWHLGEEDYYPEKQGFDVNRGGAHIAMPNDYFCPAWKESPKGLHAMWAGVPLEGRPGEYLTDRLTDEALHFIETQKNRPFFLYLAHYAVHIPLIGKPGKIEKYKKRIRPDDPQNNPVYGAMIESVDESVGRVMRKLDELGLTENTVVIFTSDNGGLDTPSVDGRRPAATSTLPLRGGKVALYEGGIRVPLIVRWPGKVKAGTVCDTPVASQDFFPTMMELAGAAKANRSIDGVSLTPLLRQQGKFKRDALYWHYPHAGEMLAPHGAVRQGNYKLIEFFEDNRLELYDLDQDLSEKHDLSTEMPAKTRQLLGKLKRWQKSVQAPMPVLNPAYQAASTSK